jgi:hypothetical protein
MNKLLLLPWLFLCIRAEHTQSFDESWAESGNENSLFFDQQTFGYLTGNDNICRKLSPVSNTKFRDYINLQFNCTGQHCINNQFICEQGDSRNCYNVEHIIEKSQTVRAICQDTKCDVNIFGNLVMAWGVWNQQLGQLSRNSPNDSYHEKLIVYGQNVFDQVISAIEQCNPGCICNTGPDKNYTPAQTQPFVWAQWSINDNRWKNIFQLTGQNGGLLVSIAMFMAYIGLKLPNQVSIDPYTLHYWIQDNDGYVIDTLGRTLIELDIFQKFNICFEDVELWSIRRY